MTKKLIAVSIFVASSISVGAHEYPPSSSAAPSANTAVLGLNRSAELAAQLSGHAEIGNIACDFQFIRCTCEGAFHCAWLAWACSSADGVQGFDGECYLPRSVPGATAAVREFKLRAQSGTTDAGCEGPICQCTGPKTSADCKKITGCADEFTCVGDHCYCIGGSVSRD